jgi:hypothetical protein
MYTSYFLTRWKQGQQKMWTLGARIAVVDVYVKQPSTAVARVKGKVDVLLRHEHGGMTIFEM